MSNGKYLSDQLSFLPDKMVEEAMEPAPKAKRHATVARILRIAACFAVIIGLILGLPQPRNSSGDVVTGPGLLSVKVCATNAHTSTYMEAPLEEGVMVPENAFVATTNSYVGIPIHLSVTAEDFPYEQITYSLSATAGLYADSERMGYTSDWHTTITCENDSTIRWDLTGHAGANWYEPLFDHCFSKIVIYCEGHIIGYAVVYYNRLYTDEWAQMHPEMEKFYTHLDQPVPIDVFYCALIESVSFPKVDGKFQDISEEYVHERMNNACVIPSNE